MFAYYFVGRYEDVLRVITRVPQENWLSSDFAEVAGSLAELGRAEEAKTLVELGVKRYPWKLIIEVHLRFAFWSEDERVKVEKTMRKAGFPVCATDEDASKAAAPLPAKRL